MEEKNVENAKRALETEPTYIIERRSLGAIPDYCLANEPTPIFKPRRKKFKRSGNKGRRR